MTNKIQSKKNPKFIRQDAHKKKRLGNAWRKPKGLQSKMRLALSGYRKSVSVGYGTKASLRNKVVQGLDTKLVKSIADLDMLNKDSDGLIISSTLGMKKKIVLLEKALAGGFTILNLKNPKKIIDDHQKSMQEKKKTKIEKEKQKIVKKEELLKKAKEKTESKEDISVEDKKDQEKQELDKILTTKEA